MKRYTLVLLLIITTFAGSPLSAAVKLDFATVDLLIYRCFIEKKWDSVIVVGKQALIQDIDYYYLRVRLGISYYNKTDYSNASVHLKKAREFNSADPVIADYLYYAYRYSNKSEEAGKIKAFMTTEGRKSVDGILQEIGRAHG